jgi:hypothetical protein
MTRVFKTHNFSRWMKEVELTDELLSIAVLEMENGLIDADLGGGVVKKRIALAGRGKSGSSRTLLATNKNDRWFFILGFEKNERDNISIKELKALKTVATDLLRYSNEELNIAVKNYKLEEICHDKN